MKLELFYEAHRTNDQMQDFLKAFRNLDNQAKDLRDEKGISLEEAKQKVGIVHSWNAETETRIMEHSGLRLTQQNINEPAPSIGGDTLYTLETLAQ